MSAHNESLIYLTLKVVEKAFEGYWHLPNFCVFYSSILEEATIEKGFFFSFHGLFSAMVMFFPLAFFPPYFFFSVLVG